MSVYASGVRAASASRVGTPAEEQEVSYLRALDERLVLAGTNCALPLSDLVRAASGSFPTVVADRSRRLGLRVQPEPGIATMPAPPQPELHPLDYEWHFTLDSARRAAAILAAEQQGPALCLGSPTVATALAALGHRGVLVDGNPLVRDRLGPSALASIEVHEHDLRQPIEATHTFGSVFFDAPWYPDEAELWLWQGVRAVRPGGLIAFSLFPWLLRPSATLDRARILKLARSYGRTSIVEGGLDYDTPRFEAEALAASGLPPMPSWRRADLVVLRVERRMNSLRPPPPLAERTWDTWIIDQQVVKLCRVTNGPAEQLLLRVPGARDWVYTSVSRRDPNRPLIDLWTSRNRVARVGRRQEVANALDRLAKYGFDAPASAGKPSSAKQSLIQILKSEA